MEQSMLGLLIQALCRSTIIHDSLGESGLQKVKKNQHGETALMADVECEGAVIRTFRESGLPVRIRSEEHGILDLGSSPPKYTVYLDGVDGSGLYIRERGQAKYATMAGVSLGINPRYADYLVSGIAQHACGRLLVSAKGQGAFCHQVYGDNSHLPLPIKASGQTTFDHSVKIYVDEWWDINKQTFSGPLKGFDVSCKDASCWYYADVAEGLAHFALECTRKGNLEIAVAYGLIAEVGGVMVNLKGNNIGRKKYLEFGQDPKEYIPVITAANQTLADQLVAFLKKQKAS